MEEKRFDRKIVVQMARVSEKNWENLSNCTFIKKSGVIVNDLNAKLHIFLKPKSFCGTLPTS
jgi:hypothetical protein